MNPVVIVGSGYAGYSVAREFRRRDKLTPLVVLTGDDGQFYSKPALSEAYSETSTIDSLVAKTAEQMAAQIKGEVRTKVRVTKIDRDRPELSLGADTQSYSQLVLAIGADPVHLPITERVPGRAFAVNGLDDYGRFRAAIHGKKHITVLGAGLIGCEFADHLNRAGYSIDVVDLAAYPLSRLLPRENGEYLRERLARAGVRWHLATRVEDLRTSQEQVKVSCADGAEWTTDIVLSAIGLKPRTALAEAAGLDSHRGIVVDRHLRTSDPAIFALGDCAEVAGHLLPYIAPISVATKVVAANLTGGDSVVSYPAMPVRVKTPTCPTVVYPPPEDANGAWTTESQDDGMQSLFYDAAGTLQGFSLHGTRVELADGLARELPMLLP
jgi:rubredoxin---NAD+ reductase